MHTDTDTQTHRHKVMQQQQQQQQQGRLTSCACRRGSRAPAARPTPSPPPSPLRRRRHPRAQSAQCCRGVTCRGLTRPGRPLLSAPLSPSVCLCLSLFFLPIQTPLTLPASLTHMEPPARAFSDTHGKRALPLGTPHILTLTLTHSQVHTHTNRGPRRRSASPH